ncbi:hypothetical protein [Kitasatospora sp. NPDC088783]|uniref:hypothetical protein n=1 Tax=Kitasatospora sp. NPDC088783 TaxID=3364077 RepID=UPI0038077A87
MRETLWPEDEEFTDPDPRQWRPEWVPLVWTTRLPAGRHWEAIRVTGPEARQTLHLLGGRIGPVIVNPYAQVAFFLLDRLHGPWQATRTARLLRHGTVVAVPQWHVRGGRDVHWAVPPGRGETDPGDLREALAGQPPQRRRPLAVPASKRHPEP